MANPTRTIKIRFDGTAKGLIKAAKEAGIAIDGVRAKAEKSIATNAGSSLLDALGALPSQLKGAAIVAAVGIGTIMAPALASAIISGVLLAVGGGVLAAGIIGAAKDARVVNAWKKFGNQAGKVFSRFSQPFVKPLIRAADVFGKALKRAEPTILKIGRTMAPIIDKLAPAFASMAEKFLPGILRAAEASVPFFDTLAAHAPKLGESFSKFFEEIAKGAPSAVRFFDRFLGFLEGAIVKTGTFLTWLSDLGTKLETMWNHPEFVEFRDALNSFKDDVLVGVKDALDDVGQAIDSNSSKWIEIKDNVASFIEFTGPGFQKLVQFIGVSVASGIQLLSQLALWISRILDGLTKIDDAYRRLTGQEKLRGGQRDGKSGSGGGGFQGFASGGRGKGWAIAGERGRELVDLGDGARVYNNQETERMLGGGGTTVIENHIHVGDEVVKVVRTVVSERDRALKRRVLAGAGAI